MKRADGGESFNFLPLPFEFIHCRGESAALAAKCAGRSSGLHPPHNEKGAARPFQTPKEKSKRKNASRFAKSIFRASPIDRPLSRCGGSSPQGSGGEPAPKQKPAAVSQSEKTAAGMGGLYRYAVRLRSPPRCRSSSTSAAFPFPPGWAGAGSSRCRRRRWHSLRSPADAPGTLPPAQSPARRGRSPGRSS